MIEFLLLFALTTLQPLLVIAHRNKAIHRPNQGSRTAMECENETNFLFKEPFTLTISPKVWDLLDTRAALITKFVESFRLPEKSENNIMLDYKVWNIFVEDFSIPKSGASFEDIDNGVHLRVKNIRFRAVAKARVAIGVMLLKAGLKGDVRVNCDDAELDLKLKWNDFKITPIVNTRADLQVKFTKSLRAANLFKKRIRKYAEEFVSDKLPDMIVELFEQKVNPMLRKLKRLLAGMGLSQFGIEWMVQNKTLRVAVKPKSAMGKIEPIKPTDKMVCIRSDLLAALQELKRSKREFESSDPTKLKLGIDLTCSAPEGECGISSCSYCADLDITPSTTENGVSAKLRSCVPPIL